MGSLPRRRNSPKPSKGQQRRSGRPNGDPDPSFDARAYLKKPGATPAAVAHAEERALESLIQKVDALHRDVEKLQERCPRERLDGWDGKLGALVERVAKLEGRGEAREVERTWQVSKKTVTWTACSVLVAAGTAIVSWLGPRLKPAEAVPLGEGRIEVLPSRRGQLDPPFCAQPAPSSGAECESGRKTEDREQPSEVAPPRSLGPERPVRTE